MTEMSEPTVTITDVVGDWTKVLKKAFKKEIAEVSRQVHNGRPAAFTLPVNRVLDNDLVLAVVERPDEVKQDLVAALQNVSADILAHPDLVTVHFARHFAPVQVKEIRSRHINSSGGDRAGEESHRSAAPGRGIRLGLPDLWAPVHHPAEAPEDCGTLQMPGLRMQRPGVPAEH